MHRSFAWGMIAILAIMLAPFAGVLGVPASTVHADTAAPTAAADDEIIVITSAGVSCASMTRRRQPATRRRFGLRLQSRVGRQVGRSSPPVTSTVTAMPNLWRLGAAKSRCLTPVVQPGRTKVNFSVDLGSGRNVRLLVTGDFDGDGKDEFAVMHYIPGRGCRQAWSVMMAAPMRPQGEWTQTNSAEYGAMFQDMSTGDFNDDGADDLVMVRNVKTQRW